MLFFSENRLQNRGAHYTQINMVVDQKPVKQSTLLPKNNKECTSISSSVNLQEHKKLEPISQAVIKKILVLENASTIVHYKAQLYEIICSR